MREVIDDRTPVLVGVAQLCQHLDPGLDDAELARAPEPAALTARAVREAEADSGGRGLLARTTGLWVVDPICWGYRDPTAPIVEELGIDPKHRLRSGVGGQVPMSMINKAARAIADGEHDVVVVAGTEAMRSRKLARRRGVRLGWTKQPDTVPEPEHLSTDRRDPVHPAERAVGLGLPVSYYPLFENALRGRYRRTIGEHTAALGRLWSAFSRVAAGNPHAWRPTALTPEQITGVTPDNRMIGFPYPKRLNADMGVDMSAAVLLTSVGTARAAGVPADRWVFPWAGASSNDHWHVGHRPDLSRSPAIAANGRAVLGAAGLRIEQVDHLDLYSCFPSAVQVAADELGLTLDPEHPPTLTGGLTFAGGPGSNYVTHATAALVARLRAEPDTVGLVSGNGWFLTKHSMGLFGGRPPAGGFRTAHPRDEVDGLPTVEVADGYDGEAALETYTVLAGDPDVAVAVLRLPDGRRVFAGTTERDVLDALCGRELLGEPMRVAGTRLLG
jgi:acetyl-CoA C-acetyltransferase